MDIKDIIINRRDFKIDGNEGMFEFFWKKKKIMEFFWINESSWVNGIE